MVKEIIMKVFGSNKKAYASKVGTFNESNRLNWLETTLKKIPDGSRILDAGAGEQPYRKFCIHLNYVSQDFGQYKPKQLNIGLQRSTWDYGKLDIECDIASIPEPDKSFDAIMCTEVLEHIINPREAIKEFARLLKKDGQLILTAPFCSLTHFAPYHFYSGFSSFFYVEELKNNGFEIIEMVPNGNYFEYIAQELRRLPSVADKYSTSALITQNSRELKKLLFLLDDLSKKDKGSSELLCFGYHVFARKL
jgi:ubiquinone/menaquinone biosynthesis C-methylase UbiE